MGRNRCADEREGGSERGGGKEKETRQERYSSKDVETVILDSKQAQLLQLCVTDEVRCSVFLFRTYFRATTERKTVHGE
jgi:hypothetical protein